MKPVLSVRKEIVVNAPQERCFRVFTAGIDRWWPRDHHIGKSPLKEFLLEPRVGGRCYSVGEDGSEVDVGRVLVWEPSSRLVLAWQITAKWQFDPALLTEVEVTFHKEGDRRTRVELEHRKLEAFGADVEAMQKTFNSDDAWVLILSLFGKMAEEARES